jgi:hypothetical protein
MNSNDHDMSWGGLAAMAVLFLTVFGGAAIWPELDIVLPELAVPEFSRPVKTIALILVVFGGIALGKLTNELKGKK